ncbi:hypothetical protein SAMN05519103_07477 [Rhizobiales bacterium GAS113]|nr:hypothetical protein SAMN05519103_07477 [Rhizobiales bacterium GAS113]
MSVDEISSFKLAGVEVRGGEVIHSWPVEEQHFLATGNVDPEIARRLPSESAQNFPPVQAYFQTSLQRVFNAQFDGSVAPIMRGTRPVKAIVTLKQFDVPSVLRRVLIDQYAKIQLDIDVVDSKTGAHVLFYPGPYRQKWLFGGLSAPIAASIAGDDDPGMELVTTYMSDYRTWLLTR